MAVKALISCDAAGAFALTDRGPRCAPGNVAGSVTSVRLLSNSIARRRFMDRMPAHLSALPQTEEMVLNRGEKRDARTTTMVMGALCIHT
jgi:hypothetical protein